MAAHALYELTLGEIPEDDDAVVVGRGKDLAGGAAGHGGDVARVASKEANAVTVRALEHAYGTVRSGGEDVGAVRVEANAINCLIVANEPAQWTGFGGGPEVCFLVVAAREEVVAEWSPGDVEDRAQMSLIHYEAPHQTELPEADGSVG